MDKGGGPRKGGSRGWGQPGSSRRTGGAPSKEHRGKRRREGEDPGTPFLAPGAGAPNFIERVQVLLSHCALNPEPYNCTLYLEPYTHTACFPPACVLPLLQRKAAIFECL